jgi:excisionase family DNA binding protein
MASKPQVLIWESVVTRTGSNAVSITAQKPLDTMTCAQAGKVLGCSRWTVQKLYQAGLITGYKPGARAVRKDGRASNAAVRLDTASVLDYRQRQLALAAAERAG